MHRLTAGAGIGAALLLAASLQAAESRNTGVVRGEDRLAQGGGRSRGFYGFPDWDSGFGRFGRSRRRDADLDKKPAEPERGRREESASSPAAAERGPGRGGRGGPRRWSREGFENSDRRGPQAPPRAGAGPRAPQGKPGVRPSEGRGDRRWAGRWRAAEGRGREAWSRRRPGRGHGWANGRGRHRPGFAGHHRQGRDGFGGWASHRGFSRHGRFCHRGRGGFASRHSHRGRGGFGWQAHRGNRWRRTVGPQGHGWSGHHGLARGHGRGRGGPHWGAWGRGGRGRESFGRFGRGWDDRANSRAERPRGPQSSSASVDRDRRIERLMREIEELRRELRR
jgi:hypothetical protein